MKLAATYKTIAILAGAYIAAQIFADITSTRIILILGLSMDAGTLIYPFTFTLRDLVHKVAGIAVARTMIVTAAVLNLLMAVLFSIVANWQPDTSIGLQQEFGYVLAPIWRIVIASICAEVLSELIDGEVYQAWVNRFAGRWQWARVLSSNAVSVPVDSAVFVVLAFAGAMPSEVVWAIFFSNVLLKGAVTLISMPWIYFVKDTHHAVETG